MSVKISDEDRQAVNDAWNKMLKSVGVRPGSFLLADAINASADNDVVELADIGTLEGQATTIDGRVDDLETHDGVIDGQISDLQIHDGVIDGQIIDLQARPGISSGPLPAADVAHRGFVWVVTGAAGVADTAYVCLKTAANTYSWMLLATGA